MQLKRSNRFNVLSHSKRVETGTASASFGGRVFLEQAHLNIAKFGAAYQTLLRRTSPAPPTTPIPSTFTHSIHLRCRAPTHITPTPLVTSKPTATRAAVNMSAISRATYRGASALSGLRAQNATAYVDIYESCCENHRSQY
jgi:hypothetical protein